MTAAPDLMRWLRVSRSSISQQPPLFANEEHDNTKNADNTHNQGHSTNWFDQPMSLCSKSVSPQAKQTSPGDHN